jgi:outer membrane protein TolC
MKKVFLLLILCRSALFAQEVMSLDDALVIALKHNPDIMKARQEIRAASGRFWSGISLPQPELSYSYEYMPLGKSLSSFGERTIEVAQELDFPTTYLLRGQALNAESAIAEWQFRKAAIGVMADVKRSYWEAKAKEGQLVIAMKNFDLADEFSRKAGIRYDAGDGTWLEKMTANVQRTQALNGIATARNEQTVALTNFLLLLGRRVEKDMTCQLSDSLEFRQRSFAVDELEQAALRKNPEIKIAEFEIKSGEKKKALAWSSLLPGFKFAWSKQALEGGRNDYYGAAFGASIPLWFLFDQRGQIEQAAAGVRGAEYEYAGRKNSLNASINEAFLNFANQERQLLLYKNELLPQAGEVYRTASISYDAGEIGYLELLQSNQTLIGVQSGYIDALLGYHQAVIRIEELSGILLDEINADGE